MSEMIRVKIRMFNGLAQSEGVWVESNADHCCPPLLPGEVVEIPADHMNANHPCLELAQEEPTRPLRFETAAEGALYKAGSAEDKRRMIEKLSMMKGAIDQKKAEAEKREAARIEGGVQSSSSALEDAEIEKALANLDDGQSGANAGNQHIRGEVHAERQELTDNPVFDEVATPVQKETPGRKRKS